MPDQANVRIYGPADTPYLTIDSILAFALYMAFTPFGDDARPCVNVYTTEKLCDLGYRGLKPQEAAIQAQKDGDKGEVTYIFKMPESRLVQIFENEKKAIAASDGLARDRVKSLMETYKQGGRDFEETIVRLVAVIVYMRAEFLKMWEQQEPLIQIDMSVQRSERQLADGSRVVETNGFKYIGAHAGEAVKRRMGLC